MMRPPHVMRRRASEKQIVTTNTLEKKKTNKDDDKSPQVIIDLSNCRYQVVRDAATSLGWTENAKNSNDWTLFWMDTSVSPERVMRMKEYQRINHFPGMSGIARKIPLARNLNRMRKMFPEQYQFLPATWVLPQEAQEFKRNKAIDDQTYIIKPNAGCQGKGIFLTKDKSEVDKYGDCVVQLYLDKPFLIEGYKFDLRVYILILAVDPLIIYMYNDGLVRLCTEKYKPPSLRNLRVPCMHLTNYSINKHSDSFESGGEDFSKGNKRNFAFLNKYIEGLGHSSEQMWNDVASIIIKTIISIQPQLKQQYNYCTANTKLGDFNCFEILGFDILFDEKLSPWLLEVNHSPSFNTDTTLDQKVKFELLQETMKMLILDPIDRIRSKKLERQRTHDRITGNVSSVPFDSDSDLSKEELVQKHVQGAHKHSANFRKIYPDEDAEMYDLLFEQSNRFASQAKTLEQGSLPRVASLSRQDKNMVNIVEECEDQQAITSAREVGNRSTGLSARSKSSQDNTITKPPAKPKFIPPRVTREELMEKTMKIREPKIRFEMPLPRTDIGMDFVPPTQKPRKGVKEEDEDILNIVRESENLLQRFASLVEKSGNL